jgi:hypothetical protein
VEVSGQIHNPAGLFPGRNSLVLIEEEYGQTSELGWTFWKTEKSLAIA